jgi:SAM-dependent methyltransferase
MVTCEPPYAPLTARTQPTTTTDLDVAPDVRDYLVVDEFLRSLIGSRALKTALELGVIDTLEQGPADLAGLATSIRSDTAGIRLLIDLLAAEGVVEESTGTVRLTPRFAGALQYRELLERKLDFVGLVLLDFVDRFNALIVDPARFMREAQLFRLFDYRRASDMSAENYAWTKVWMRLTTALTRHEAEACLRYHDFSPYRSMLDIGGNSGEFALRACKAHPQLRASIMDLPVVCEFGQDHVLAEPERERISFIAGSALEKQLPSGCDLITFKSMLHDWPDAEARRFIDRAAEALEPGGTLLIFERGPLDLRAGPLPLSALPMLMFARSFRSPGLYESALTARAFTDIEIREVPLDTPFFIVTANKPGA